MVPPSRLVRADELVVSTRIRKRHLLLSRILRQVNLLHLTLLLLQTVSTRRITFKRPPNLLDRAEPPKRTSADDDDDCALLSVHHRDLGKVSEKLVDKNGVYCGTGMLDMLDNAWPQKSEPAVDANSVEPSQDVSNLLVTVSFSLDEERMQTNAAIPIPRQPSM